MIAHRSAKLSAIPTARDELNYRHLHYFWMAVRLGSMASAATELGLAKPTVSGQIAAFEKTLGICLFDKKGKHLCLSDAGRVIFAFAEDIFSLGQQLLTELHQGRCEPPQLLAIGLANGLSQRLAARLLAPFTSPPGVFELQCRSGSSSALVTDLRSGQLDFVFSAEALRLPQLPRLWSHRLGDCGTSFLASTELAAGLREHFPHSLDGAPIWLPAPETLRRRAIDDWFDAHHIRPQPCGHGDDEGFQETMAVNGAVIITVPTILENDLLVSTRLRLVGRADALRETVSVAVRDHRTSKPLLPTLLRTADQLFGTGRGDNARGLELDPGELSGQDTPIRPSQQADAGSALAFPIKTAASGP
jgi:LysR family transcriptional regulator, transcriptional activator of nhaA